MAAYQIAFLDVGGSIPPCATASYGVTSKLIGFNDLLENAKKNDAGAFVDEKAEQNQATFTNPMGAVANTEPITGDPNKMDFATYKKWREQNQ